MLTITKLEAVIGGDKRWWTNHRGTAEDVAAPRRVDLLEHCQFYSHYDHWPDGSGLKPRPNGELWSYHPFRYKEGSYAVYVGLNSPIEDIGDMSSLTVGYSSTYGLTYNYYDRHNAGRRVPTLIVAVYDKNDDWRRLIGPYYRSLDGESGCAYYEATPSEAYAQGLVLQNSNMLDIPKNYGQIVVDVSNWTDGWLDGFFLSRSELPSNVFLGLNVGEVFQYF